VGKYGTDFLSDEWATIVRTTHWTEKDVVNEAARRTEAVGLEPDYVLNAFEDLLSIVGLRAKETTVDRSAAEQQPTSCRA
jgi:hypothetical protein